MIKSFCTARNELWLLFMHVRNIYVQKLICHTNCQRKYFHYSAGPNFNVENPQFVCLVMNQQCGRSELQEHNSASMKNIGNSLLTMCEVRMRGNIFICQEKYWWPSWKILSGNMSHTAALWHHLTSHIYVFSFKPHPEL